MSPPLNDKAAFIAWGKANTNEDPIYLERRFDRYKVLLDFNDLYTPAEKRAFLLTPRQQFRLEARTKPMSVTISTSASASPSPRPAPWAG